VDNDVQRRAWIKARIEAISQELDELIRELGEGGDEAGRPRRKFTIIKGGMVLLLLFLGVAYLVARYRRALAGAAVAAGAASVVAVALLSHSAPRPPGPAHGAPHATAAPPTAALSPGGRRASPRPERSRTPTVPIVVPTRARRAQAPSQGPSSAPVPAPSRAPSVPASASAPATPSPAPAFSCSVGLRLVVVGTGLRICV